jgi:peptidoglycan/xylan/chitin deacetylase (PgdA/CDA1 family)
LKPLLQLLSPGGARARLSILIFHRVLPQPDPLLPDEMFAERFDRICEWVSRAFNVLPLDGAIRDLAADRLPPRALAITFDDGYADNHDVALPILLRHGLTATFFIATGFLDGGMMWNDRIAEALRATSLEDIDLQAIGLESAGRLPLGSYQERGAAVGSVIRAAKYLPVEKRLELVSRLIDLADVQLPGGLMMRSDQVRAMHHAGMGIGAHSVRHPILASLTRDQAFEEVATSKARLEELIAARVGLFAYPNGRPDRDFSAQTIEVVRDAGFDAAVTTSMGATVKSTPRFQLPRFTPWDITHDRFIMRTAVNMLKKPEFASS